MLRREMKTFIEMTPHNTSYVKILLPHAIKWLTAAEIDYKELKVSDCDHTVKSAVLHYIHE